MSSAGHASEALFRRLYIADITLFSRPLCWTAAIFRTVTSSYPSNLLTDFYFGPQNLA